MSKLVSIYQPIEAAPAIDKFWAWRGSIGALVLVERTDLPEHRHPEDKDAVAVIDWRSGAYWWPAHFISGADLPMPPGVAQ